MNLASTFFDSVGGGRFFDILQRILLLDGTDRGIILFNQAEEGGGRLLTLGSFVERIRSHLVAHTELDGLLDVNKGVIRRWIEPSFFRLSLLGAFVRFRWIRRSVLLLVLSCLVLLALLDLVADAVIHCVVERIGVVEMSRRQLLPALIGLLKMIDSPESDQSLLDLGGELLVP